MNDVPGLVTVDSIVKCGKCKFTSAAVVPDGKNWIDRETAARLAEANGMQLEEWLTRVSIRAALRRDEGRRVMNP